MSSAVRKKLIANYSTHTNRWAAGDLLPIAIAYAMEGQDPQSESAYTNYLKVKPDDARANRGLGLVYLSQKRFREAIESLGKAWRLGDKNALPPLAAAYLKTGHREQVRNLLQDMLKIKKEAKDDLRDNVVQAMLAYALTGESFDSKAFAEAIDGVSDDEIMRNDGAPELVIKGLKLAGDEKRAAALKKRLERRTPQKKDQLL